MEKYGIILAGGMGNRLWPLSRKNSPKQLLKINGKTMLEKTVERLEVLFKKENIFIITREELKEKVHESMRGISPDNIIVEKESIGTAHAIAIGVETILKKMRMRLFPFFHLIHT